MCNSSNANHLVYFLWFCIFYQNYTYTNSGSRSPKMPSKFFSYSPFFSKFPSQNFGLNLKRKGGRGFDVHFCFANPECCICDKWLCHLISVWVSRLKLQDHQYLLAHVVSRLHCLCWTKCVSSLSWVCWTAVSSHYLLCVKQLCLQSILCMLNNGLFPCVYRSVINIYII